MPPNTSQTQLIALLRQREQLRPLAEAKRQQAARLMDEANALDHQHTRVVGARFVERLGLLVWEHHRVESANALTRYGVTYMTDAGVSWAAQAYQNARNGGRTYGVNLTKCVPGQGRVFEDFRGYAFTYEEAIGACWLWVIKQEVVPKKFYEPFEQARVILDWLCALVTQPQPQPSPPDDRAVPAFLMRFSNLELD